MDTIALILLIFGATLKLEEELQKRNPNNQITSILEKDLVRFWTWRANPKFMDELRTIRIFAKNCAITSFLILFLVVIISGIVKPAKIPGLTILLNAIYISFGIWGSLSWVIDHKGSLHELKWPVVFSIFIPWILLLSRWFGFSEVVVPKELLNTFSQFGITGDPLVLACTTVSLFLVFSIVVAYPILWIVCGLPVILIIALLFILSIISHVMLRVVTRRYHPYIYWTIAVTIGTIKYFKE